MYWKTCLGFLSRHSLEAAGGRSSRVARAERAEQPALKLLLQTRGLEMPRCWLQPPLPAQNTQTSFPVSTSLTASAAILSDLGISGIKGLPRKTPGFGSICLAIQLSTNRSSPKEFSQMRSSLSEIKTLPSYPCHACWLTPPLSHPRAGAHCNCWAGPKCQPEGI